MALSKKDLREVEKLIRLSQRGDAEAFGELYDKLVVLIYRYIYYRVNHQDAEDLTELVFLKAWENRKKYKNKKEASFLAWLFRIAHNIVVDHYRTAAKTQTVELSEEIADLNYSSDNPADEVQLKFDQLKLARLIRKLPEIQQQVIVLKFVNDFSNAEIAKIIDKSVGAVRVIQYRALSRLKKLLDQSETKGRNTSAILTFKTVRDV